MLEYLVPIGVWDLTKNLKSIWKLCLISFFLFLGIHSFHLVNTSFLRIIKALSFDLDGISKVTFTTGLTKKIPFIISAKNLKVILCSVTKGKWNPCDWKYIICLFKFWHQRDVILQFCLSRTLHIFQLNIFILKESSKRYLFFSYLSTFFVLYGYRSCQELSFNHILKETLFPIDLLIIKKTRNRFDQRLFELCHWNVKAILLCVRNLELAKCNTL